MSSQEFPHVPGAVTAPAGFRAAAVNCGLKPSSPDLTLLVSDQPATVAVTLTRNRFRAAPTYVTEAHAADGSARAVVVNSGNANAATGAEGLADAHQMAELAAAALGLPGDEVLVCSTGIIGERLPMAKIAAGIPSAVAALSASAGEDAARGIMTTDTVPKFTAVEFPVGGATVRLGGICKGAGMICPHMATMLCFLTTDAAVPADLLQSALSGAVEQSFNCLTVDGDMSTNDTVILFANGAGGAVIDSAASADYAAFCRAVEQVTRELAQMIARDGEAATKFITIEVTGAHDFEQARRVGKAVANYTLLKTALWGGDFNWGRLAAAVGATEEDFDPAQVTLTLAGITTWEHGRRVAFDRGEALRQVQQKEIAIAVDLGRGEGRATVWTCDLSPGYVEFNAEYEVGDEPEQAG